MGVGLSSGHCSYHHSASSFYILNKSLFPLQKIKGLYHKLLIHCCPFKQGNRRRYWGSPTVHQAIPSKILFLGAWQEDGNGLVRVGRMSKRCRTYRDPNNPALPIPVPHSCLPPLLSAYILSSGQVSNVLGNNIQCSLNLRGRSFGCPTSLMTGLFSGNKLFTCQAN